MTPKRAREGASLSSFFKPFKKIAAGHSDGQNNDQNAQSSQAAKQDFSLDSCAPRDPYGPTDTEPAAACCQPGEGVRAATTVTTAGRDPVKDELETAILTILRSRKQGATC